MKGLIFLIVLGGLALMKAIAIGRARAADEKGGCVACGSLDLLVRGDTRMCGDCGYQGRADGGGQLSEGEIEAIYDHGR